MNKIHNIRINDMISYSKDNKKLGYLIASGLLDRDKNVLEIMKGAN